MYLRCPSAKIVSNANEDLPLPLSPVITVRLLRGISTSISFKLCTRAPYTLINSLSSIIYLCFQLLLAGKFNASGRNN